MNKEQQLFKCCSCKSEFERDIITIRGSTHICFSCVRIMDNEVRRFMRNNKNPDRKLYPDSVGSMLSGYMEYKLR